LCVAARSFAYLTLLPVPTFSKAHALITLFSAHPHCLYNPGKRFVCISVLRSLAAWSFEKVAFIACC
jgi:hypothetical protein